MTTRRRFLAALARLAKLLFDHYGQAVVDAMPVRDAEGRVINVRLP